MQIKNGEKQAKLNFFNTDNLMRSKLYQKKKKIIA